MAPGQRLGVLLGQLCQGLLPAVKRGQEDGIMHAKRLMTALLYAGAAHRAACLAARRRLRVLPACAHAAACLAAGAISVYGRTEPTMLRA
jgi:hypothetical protein